MLLVTPLQSSGHTSDGKDLRTLNANESFVQKHLLILFYDPRILPVPKTTG